MWVRVCVSMCLLGFGCVSACACSREEWLHTFSGQNFAILHSRRTKVCNCVKQNEQTEPNTDHSQDWLSPSPPSPPNFNVGKIVSKQLRSFVLEMCGRRPHSKSTLKLGGRGGPVTTNAWVSQSISKFIANFRLTPVAPFYYTSPLLLY